MDRAWGLTLIAGGAVLSLACAVVLHRRVPPMIVYSLAAIGGAATGSGALLVQTRDAAPGDWLVTLAALGVLVPAHIRVVFGPARRE